MSELIPMTEESVRNLLEAAGARVASRGGRTSNYSAPREFSFEVRAQFANGLGLHVVARQYNYRDPWEAQGRINDLVDVTLLRDGALSPLPRGHHYFQGREEECGVDESALRELIAVVSAINPKIFRLQELTGDL